MKLSRTEWHNAKNLNDNSQNCKMFQDFIIHGLRQRCESLEVILI